MEMIFNVTMGILIVFYLVLAFLLDTKSTEGDFFGAGGFPITVGIIALLVLASITYNTLKDKIKVQLPLFNLKSQEGKRLVLSIAVLSAYLIFMNIIGFTLSTLLFLFGIIRAMGYKKMVMLSVFSIILAAVLVVVFGKFFFVPLPRGIGIFRELSYLLY